MQLEPGITYLACARLIVPFVPFSACGKATKGIARGEAGTPCKEKSAGKKKEVKKNRGRRSSTHG